MERSTTRIASTASTLVLIIGAMLLAAPTDAQVAFGARIGVWADPTDPFVGVEALVPLRPLWTLDPNVEVVFGDHETTGALSCDALYRLERTSSATYWIGAGPSFLLTDLRHGGTDTDFGLNLLVRAELTGSRSYSPYVEGKVVLSNNNRAALGFGVRF